MTAARYLDLAGKVVLVTGGTGGIGAPLCRALAAQGVRVAVAARDGSAATALAAALAAGLSGPAALGIAADCTVPDQVEAMRERVVRELGPPDGLVCLAGGALIGAAPVHLLTSEQWDYVLRGNLTATFQTIRAFLPLMLDRGRGSIVTTASAAARVPATAAPATTAAYTAAKAGVIALTQHVARETAGHGVRVNCVSPSVVVTGTNAPSGPRREALLREHPLARLGEPQDVASAVLFLLSAASSWITGTTLDVTGGRVTTHM